MINFLEGTGLVVVLLALIFFNLPLIVTSVIIVALLVLLTMVHGLTIMLAAGWLIALSVILILNVRPVRRKLITAQLYRHIKHKMPVISKTEQEVLDAGDVWWEKDLFTGRPDWKNFLKLKPATLTSAEQSFLDNEVNVLCAKLKDWEIINTGTIPDDVWDYVKKERFLGLSIPKQYGGHGFSTFAHSTIIMKIASRSYSAAVSIMVPNSVGLAEFILHYGTKEQKNEYLPKFVAGQAIPCFALTGPEAGSDAGSMQDYGVVMQGEYQGESTLGVKLNFDKRYITLAPIATMIGLAFKMLDPQHLLGHVNEIGITLAMIPRDTPGIDIGARHSPLSMAFYNGPIKGRDVFIPLRFLIGGEQAGGKGWSMMMECLSVGRGVSVPALSTAMTKLAFRTTSAYVKVREQFHVSIGAFEGIKEPLARIGAFTYLCEATRHLTAAAIDQGVKPSIATAMSKYHLTEMCRKAVNDAMDVHGGRGIQLGPKNYLGLFYIAQPISITVEGANILTRNLIIFGQGALRCHPFIRQEVAALKEPDPDISLKKFDRLFFKHIGYVLSNTLKVFFYGLTGGYLITTPRHGYTAKFYRQLTRMSVALALVTDMAMGVLGGKLKQRERLSARLGDVASYLYLSSAALKYYEDQQQPPEDLPFIDWILTYCLAQIQLALVNFFANFPRKGLAKLIKLLIFPWGDPYVAPLDDQDHHLADLMMQTGKFRERLTNNIYHGDVHDIINQLEKAFSLRISADAAYQKVQAALKKPILNGRENNFHDQIMAAKHANILTDQEVNQLLELDRLRSIVIQVDEFRSLKRDEQYDREQITT